MKIWDRVDKLVFHHRQDMLTPSNQIVLPGVNLKSQFLYSSKSIMGI